jgi:GntR family transcriptional regulator
MVAPKWQQIADDLGNQIKTGLLAPGAQLPTEIELMESRGASRNTVRSALQKLTAKGLILSRGNQGTFVAEEINPFVTTIRRDPRAGLDEDVVYQNQVTAELREPTVRDLKVEISEASAYISEMLQLELGEEVIIRKQQRYIDGLPWSLQMSYYPLSLADAAPLLIRPKDITIGTVEYLRESSGLNQFGYEDLILARPANSEEARFFRIQESSVPILEQQRVGYTDERLRFRITITSYASDRNRLKFVVEGSDDPQ